MLDLTDLKYFATVAQEGGVTRAAERLFRVQSNVTTRVKKLEAQLGLSLFHRDGKRMVLTADGHRLLDYAHRLLELAEEAERTVAGAHIGGVLRIGSMESTASVRLPKVLGRLNVEYPEIELELTTGNPVRLQELVLDGKVDVAFAAGVEPNKRLDRIAAFEEQVALVSLSSELSETAPLLVLETGCPHRALLQEWIESRGVSPARMIEIGSYHAMFGCVLAGMGTALVPESVIGTFPDQGLLKRHPLPNGPGTLVTDCFWRRDGLSANARALISILGRSNGAVSAP